jgi:hypothetical protein
VNAGWPECGEVLTERAEASVLRWQCRVGVSDADEDDHLAESEGVA